MKPYYKKLFLLLFLYCLLEDCFSNVKSSQFHVILTQQGIVMFPMIKVYNVCCLYLVAYILSSEETIPSLPFKTIIHLIQCKFSATLIIMFELMRMTNYIFQSL